MRGKFLIGLIVASMLLLAAIFFLLPPAPGEPGSDSASASTSGSVIETDSSGTNDPFAFGDMPGSEDGAEEATPEQIAMMEKMHAALPGNLFLPILPTDTDRQRVEARDQKLLQMRAIHFKIEKSKASPAERERYYDFRMRYNRDKIALLKYIAIKKPGSDDSEILSPHIEKMIADLKAENEEFAAKR